MKCLQNLAIAVLAIAASLIAVGSASADPGAGVFTNTNTNGSITRVELGKGTLVYTFTTAVDSVAFTVVSNRADLCFDSDKTSSTAGAARVSVWFAIDPTNVVTVSSLQPDTVPVDTNCVVLIQGIHWIDVTTGRSAAEEPVVTITGRSS